MTDAKGGETVRSRTDQCRSVEMRFGQRGGEGVLLATCIVLGAAKDWLTDLVWMILVYAALRKWTNVAELLLRLSQVPG